MRLPSFLAIFALLAACQTTAHTIKEPERSEYYFFCLRNGLHATTCQCMEDVAVAKTGIRTIGELDPESEKVAAFLKALNEAVPACQERTKALIESDK